MGERVPVSERARWVQPITIRDDHFVMYEATSVVGSGKKRRAYCQRVVDQLHEAGVVVEDAKDSAGCVSILDQDCGTELHEVFVNAEGWDLLMQLTWRPGEEVSHG